jgi:anthranilate phosphoribosyltransferase
VAGEARDLKQGVEIAADSIDTGKAKAALEALARITNDHDKPKEA